MKYLNDVKSTGLLYEMHPFGGDHGGGSFKTSFQVAHVLHPNQPNNTVVFSIMEAKDLRSNLMLCLERFKAHIDKFSAVTWKEKVFRVFLFGDYKFLCKMFGLSGASGKHPCLWCQVPSDMMNLPPSDRVHYAPRSLESLTEIPSDMMNLPPSDRVHYAPRSLESLTEIPSDMMNLPPSDRVHYAPRSLESLTEIPSDMMNLPPSDRVHYAPRSLESLTESLWCQIPSDMMNLPPSDRVHYAPRSLESLTEIPSDMMNLPPSDRVHYAPRSLESLTEIPSDMMNLPPSDRVHYAPRSLESLTESLWCQIPSDMMNLPPSDRVHYAPRSLESLTESLWCQIPSDMMNLPPSDRVHYAPRSLESLTESLWCQIPSDMMNLPPSDRVHYAPRSLESLTENLEEFRVIHHSNVKKAKFVKNVINDRFFNVSLTQVCVPGLHITLGVVFKFVQLYELFARDIDFRIAAEVAKSNNSITDTESVELVQAYQKIFEIEKTLVELEEARINIVDEMNWASIVSEDEFDEGNYTSLLKDVADEVDTQQKNLVKLKDEGNVMGIAFDLCEKSVDVSLTSIGVDRQAYYGGTIIGNQCHKLLKPQNVDVVCAAIPQIVLKKNGDGFVYQLSVEKCRNYSTLFKKYAIIYLILLVC